MVLELTLHQPDGIWRSLQHDAVLQQILAVILNNSVPSAQLSHPERA